MNRYIRYMDNIPPVPLEILPTVQQIIDSPVLILSESLEKVRYPHSLKNNSSKRVNEELKNWILNNFDEEVVAVFIIFNENLSPHKDARNYAFNYILDTGGEDIYTRMFSGEIIIPGPQAWHSLIRGESPPEKSEELVELECVKIESHRWHYLETGLNHSVTGDRLRPRVILSVTPSKAFPSQSSVWEYVKNWQIGNWALRDYDTNLAKSSESN